MPVDSAYRKSSKYKSRRKPKGGQSPSAKRKKVSRAGAKAAPSGVSERYGPSTKRKSSRKPGGSAASAKKRKTKAMSAAAGKSAPSYVKTKSTTRGSGPKRKGGRTGGANPTTAKPKPRPKPRIEHTQRKPKPKAPRRAPSRNVVHGTHGPAGLEAWRKGLDKGLKKAGRVKQQESKFKNYRP